MTPLELAARWRQDAEVMEQYGSDQIARICRQHADAIDEALRSVADDTLDLTAAARESGLSVDRLRHKVANGEIPNAGRKGSPLIRRGDLPVKRRAATNTFDPSAVAQSILQRANQ